MNDLCPVCRKGHLQPATYMRTFAPDGVAISVELHTSRCDQCGETTTNAAQHKGNLRALAERKSSYGDVLMGEEILALRKRYGISQQQAAKTFGIDVEAFACFEREENYPTKMIKILITSAIENPRTMKSLADKAGIELPLWQKHHINYNPGYTKLGTPSHLLI
ncbi:type II TA system antitoxin MqsA family protein [Parachitinimonas caeni]|uniref:Type II toxin-antitoxin system MqsA family antitoxin n=1 Tax=Parachitinimonas caeni TaxID=3031301 RepID=A0ABT7E498_9NEIS|nr:type II TA system antitoxin MqsA family protein [Parachitinimonas caeni]MDK2126250.1 type II toxin-antitoxin system MqsA family antitoxin [Parachitinimonas caeni]